MRLLSLLRGTVALDARLFSRSHVVSLLCLGLHTVVGRIFLPVVALSVAVFQCLSRSGLFVVIVPISLQIVRRFL